MSWPGWAVALAVIEGGSRGKFSCCWTTASPRDPLSPERQSQPESGSRRPAFCIGHLLPPVISALSKLDPKQALCQPRWRDDQGSRGRGSAMQLSGLETQFSRLLCDLYLSEPRLSHLHILARCLMQHA